MMRSLKGIEKLVYKIYTNGTQVYKDLDDALKEVQKLLEGRRGFILSCSEGEISKRLMFFVAYSKRILLEDERIQ